MSWIKLPNTKARYFSGGFDYIATAAGSTYHPPASASEHIINADLLAVDFSGGNLPTDFSNMVTLGMNSKVTNMSSNKLGLTFGLTTGLYRGSVTDPYTGKGSAFTGVVFQKADFGYGYLLGTNRSSRVDIAP
jgi:hypothetical protein